MQTKLNFVCIYTHNNMVAIKNTPKILIVSITKLKIALLIIVQNLVVNTIVTYLAV